MVQLVMLLNASLYSKTILPTRDTSYKGVPNLTIQPNGVTMVFLLS